MTKGITVPRVRSHLVVFYESVCLQNNMDKDVARINSKRDIQFDPLSKLWGSSDQLEAVFRAYPDVLFRLDQGGRILEYKAGRSSSLLEMLPDEFLGKCIQDILPNEVGEQFSHAVEQVMQSGKMNSLQFKLCKTEEDRWFEARLVTFAESQIVVVVRDITTHIISEARIRFQLKRLAALRSIDTAITASFSLDLTLSILIKQVIELLNADAADILLLNPHTRILQYAAGQGFKNTEFQQVNSIIGQGYAGLAALDRKTIYIPNLKTRNTDRLRSPMFLHEGFVSYYAIPIIAKGEVKGVQEIYRRSPMKPDNDWLEFAEMLAGQAAIAIDSAHLFKDLQRTNDELISAYDATIEGWSRALDLRDQGTEGHTQRVAEMSVQLARSLGLKETELVHIRRGALLHDIGKMGIPDSILQKPGPLDDNEWEIMHHHPQLAYEMLEPVDYLKSSLDIPHYHHEKWDGSGYPVGLKGEQIPLAARIFAVVDVYDALTSIRPYRPAWSQPEAKEYIRVQAGIHFNPQIAQAFLQMIAVLGCVAVNKQDES